MPTRNIKRTYIGGTTSEARKKYFNLDKELTQVVTNLATSYGISPALVIDRLAHEGIIDRLINDYNAHVQRGGEERPSRAFSTNTFNSPYGLFGLDNIFDTYTKGITKTKRPINFKKYTTTNESGERVNTGDTNNIYDTLELFTAELASRREQVKKQYPNLTNDELDSATAARYNATNKYFKQLMDSGEYKTKYPVDVKGVNIPTPTKTDSKYIQDQTHTVNMDKVFRMSPKEMFVYKDKSWNPKLFMTNGYIDEPESPIVKHFLNNYAVQNFTQPNKVNFIQEKYKCGGRRKARLGLDIREGGIAIPIANNMWYIHGRKHEDGGVTMGPNNKNGVEVEGGEVVEMIDSNHPSVGRQFAAGGQSQTMRVFSSVPLLRGVSPAQLVMGGANPNKVFAAQEEFKDRNRINDDGTRYEVGGEKTIKYEDLPNVFKGKQVNGRILQGGVPPILSQGAGLTRGNFIQRMGMWNDDLGEFSKYIAKRIHKFIPKKLDLPYRYVVDYFSNKGPNNAIDNNAENLTKAVSLFNAHEYKAGGIYIKPSKRGTFTAAATKHGMGVQEFANKVLANKEDYSPAMVKKANFARNASRWKKEYGGSMIYEINGNVKNSLMSARPKAQYGLASKYLKKKNKTTQKPVETKQKEESKILDIRNTAGYKVKQVAENPWVKYPIEVASYLLTGATAKGMQTGAKIASKAVNKIDDILGKPRQEYLSRNISDKTINYATSSKNSVGSTYKATPKDLNRAKKEVQNRPTINDLAEARSTVGNVPQHTTISYNSSPQNPVSTINYFDVKNTRLPNIERFGRKQMDAKISRELDKVYRKAVGNKEPKSGFGRVPQQTTIEYTPKGESINAYDASAEFHKRISDMLYNSLVKKYGKKGVDKAMKAERISKYEYGGRIKAKGGKFLKYKNGIFADPETGEEFEVDPEVFKMYGNTKESGVIPTADYTKGTFNARPQYYAEKQLPIAGSQSIAEKAGLARSGWSYGENPTVDYVPTINLTVPENYSKGIASSTPRGRGTKASTPKATAKTTTKGADVKYGTPLEEKKESLYITGIKNNSVTPLRAGMEKIKSPSSTGGGTQSKEAPWIPQYNLINTRDWIGVGTNLAGHIASYFANNALLKKAPMPIKPVQFQAAKLRTTHNINPELANINEVTQMNLAEVGRNTASSNTSIARKQRIMNEARDARNKLYGQKENIETQLINLDRRNRQDVYNRNIAAYNDWLDKTYVAKSNNLVEKQRNLNNLISGIPMAVNTMLETIESRKSTNDMIQAMSASRPNVDGRLLGIGDY